LVDLKKVDWSGGVGPAKQPEALCLPLFFLFLFFIKKKKKNINK
jgi:hypothetical protein